LGITVCRSLGSSTSMFGSSYVNDTGLSGSDFLTASRSQTKTPFHITSFATF
jgi:hypothetical protein